MCIRSSNTSCLANFRFFLLAGGFKNAVCAKAAGWWGIWASGLAFYNANAILLRDMWKRDVLPQVSGLSSIILNF